MTLPEPDPGVRRSRVIAVVLVLGAVVILVAIAAVGGGEKPSLSSRPVALVCGVPTSVFAQTPRPLPAGQEGDEVRRDGSLLGREVPALWRVYTDGDKRAYLAGDPPTLHATWLKQTRGAWKLWSGGGCNTIVEPAGTRAAAVWAIPREGVDRSLSSFTVVVTDTQCASGRSADERVGQAHVRETDTTVTVTFTAKRAGTGFQSCPGHAEARRVVKLSRPLGERALLDGGAFPPQPACIVGGPPPEPDYCDAFFYA